MPSGAKFKYTQINDLSSYAKLITLILFTIIILNIYAELITHTLSIQHFNSQLKGHCIDNAVEKDA